MPFCIVAFRRLAQYVAAMIAVVSDHVEPGDRSIVTGVNATISTRRSRVQSTDTFAKLGLRGSFWMFSPIKKSRPNWDANSWQDVFSVDTNSLRHLPRRSSKNCDLQVANIAQY